MSSEFLLLAGGRLKLKFATEYSHFSGLLKRFVTWPLGLSEILDIKIELTRSSPLAEGK